jgi:hypothetical protein
MDKKVENATFVRHARVISFAASELALDVIYALREHFQTDLESIAIYICVAEATMRPLMVGDTARPDLLHLSSVPDEFRGWISRNSVADKMGFPRETVRRKVDALVTAGHLSIDSRGMLRVVPRVEDVRLQAALLSLMQKFAGFDARVKQIIGET